VTSGQFHAMNIRSAALTTSGSCPPLCLQPWYSANRVWGRVGGGGREGGYDGCEEVVGAQHKATRGLCAELRHAEGAARRKMWK